MSSADGVGRGTCPRCTSLLSHIGGVCTNPRCSYPNPEPGTITALRWRVKARANDVLQAMRERGDWPRIP